MGERTFRAVLQELRKAKKISQEELAFRMEMDRSYISLLERNLRVPTLTTLFKVAAVLDIRPEDFIARMQVASPYPIPGEPAGPEEASR